MSLINGTKQWLEGALTIGFFFVSNIFTYPIVLLCVSESMWYNASLMAIGLYDLKRCLDRDRSDNALRKKVAAYITGEKDLNDEILQAVYSLIKNSVIDAAVNFRRAIIGTLPILLTKLYFAYMETSQGSYISIFRLIVILFSFCRTINACHNQEESLISFLKIGNLYDVALFAKRTFNPNLSGTFTSFLAYVAITTSLLYRIYAINFYTIINPFFGFAQLTSTILFSLILHLALRPVYENSPVGVPTLTFDIVEVVAKLFVLRTSRLYKTRHFFQRRLLFFWISFLVVEHIFSIGLTHLTFGATAQTGVNYTNFRPHWIESTFSDLAHDLDLINPNQFLNGISNALLQILGNSVFLNLLFVLNIVANSANLIFIGFAHLNDSEFPAVVAHHIWNKVLFAKIQKWAAELQPNEQPNEQPIPKKQPNDHSIPNKQPNEHPVPNKRPNEHHLPNKQPNEHPVPNKQPNEHHIPNKQPNEHPVPNKQPNEHHIPNRQPNDHPIQNNQPKEHPIQNKQPNEHPTQNKQPNEHPTQNKQPNEHPVQNKQPNEHPTQNKQPNDHPIQNNQPNEHPIQNKQPNEHPTQNKQPNEHPTQNKQPNEHPVQNQQPNEHPTQNKQPNEHPIPNEQPNEYPIPNEQPNCMLNGQPTEQPNQLQREWLTKFMVLTLLTAEEIFNLLPLRRRFLLRNITVDIDWTELAREIVGDTPAPNLDYVIAHAQKQSNGTGLLAFAHYVYSIQTEDATVLQGLADLVCQTLDSKMSNMTSQRIGLICDILEVNPRVKSPFKNKIHQV